MMAAPRLRRVVVAALMTAWFASGSQGRCSEKEKHAVTDAPMDRDEAAELLRDLILFGNDGRATQAWLREKYATPRRFAAIEAFPEITSFGVLYADVDTATVTPTLQKLPNLEVVQLFHCPRITDDVMPFIVALPKLTYVQIAGTGITDRGLPALLERPAITTLDVSDTAITDAGLATVAKLPSLLSLEFSNDAITDAGLESLCEHKTLAAVWASGTRITDKGMRHLATCPQLADVLARETQLTDAGIEAIAAAKNLKVLHAGGTFTRRSIDALAAGPKLHTLLLEGDVRLGDEDIEAIGKLRTVERLLLLGSRITPAGAGRLKALLPKTFLDVGPKAPVAPDKPKQ